ncbi:hypothetical protein OOK13_44045 [Streptomyces sp. NBC_00378]|uniref:hypothetical protein n=1 Tax=unclassified Streptomyces TaxID=2593676 RepID=UPI0022577A71|nr:MULTISPECIES: hypothetical protein [unclassified Streptomyces]MCX5115297.1 hypothetical protein [Streptomyces sp. NBC_00378]
MTTVPRAEADPNAVIVDLIAAIEPGLPPDTVQRAIAQAVHAKPRAVLLARTLERDPGLLTSGRAEGPASVERLIRSLAQVGATNVVRPPCSRCGRLEPLTNTDGSGLRTCASCGRARPNGGWTCSVCGKRNTPRYGLDRSGREACRSCYRAECTEDPTADLLNYLNTLAFGLDESVLQDVVAEVTKGSSPITRRLLWDIQNQPGLLAGQAHHYGPRTLLLAERLHQAGADGVPAPKCPHCDRAIRLSHSIKRLRVCGTCYNRSTAQPCTHCGRTRPVAGRTTEGAPFCSDCRNKDVTCQETCVNCGRHRAVSARTGNGPLCSSCRKPPRMQCSTCGKVRPCFHSAAGTPRCRACLTKLEPCTDCGRPSRVVARTPRGPFCENCWEVAPEARKPCQQCGTVEKLFHFGLCQRCAGERHLRQLLTSPNGELRPELDRVATALLDFNSRRTLLYLRESATAKELVTDLGTGACDLTHEDLDARMSGPKDLSVDYFRSVLVSAGVLPVRDEYLARLERWVQFKIEALDDPEDRQLITAFARWDRVVRIRRRARGKPISPAAVDVAQSQIAKAVTFLTWLKKHDATLAICDQTLIDLWLTSENHQGPYIARAFVAWAVRSKYASGISIPNRPQRSFYRPLDADERWTIARQLLNDDSFETRDRVTGLMVLLYGQTPAKISQLTTSHVIHDDKGVAIQLHKTPLRLPPPLDELVLQLVEIARSHEHMVMSNEQNTPWLFPTQRPGKPLTNRRLTRRLHNIGLPSEAARCAALLDLCIQMPPAVLQRLLGVSSFAAERWAAGAVRTAYAAEVARRSDT